MAFDLDRRGFLGMLSSAAAGLAAAGSGLIVPKRLLDLPQRWDHVPEGEGSFALTLGRRVVAAKLGRVRYVVDGDRIDVIPEPLVWETSECDLPVESWGTRTLSADGIRYVVPMPGFHRTLRGAISFGAVHSACNGQFTVTFPETGGLRGTIA